MIEQLNRKGTVRLIVAIHNQAKRDIKLYGKKRRRGSDYISFPCYSSALNYLDVEFPVVREILTESFKEKTQWQEKLIIKNT